MNKLLKVKCPQCDTAFLYYESEFRPFCCERCKMIDLGHWFEESYKLPDKEVSKTVNNNEKSENEENGPQNKKNQNKNKNNTDQTIENEDFYDEYTQIDEESYDENDY